MVVGVLCRLGRRPKGSIMDVDEVDEEAVAAALEG